jgi:hypothetical protein
MSKEPLESIAEDTATETLPAIPCMSLNKKEV